MKRDEEKRGKKLFAVTIHILGLNAVADTRKSQLQDYFRDVEFKKKFARMGMSIKKSEDLTHFSEIRHQPRRLVSYFGSLENQR